MKTQITQRSTREIATMTHPILVVLKRHQRPEAVVPYLEMITRPGMQVVFLIPHPIGGGEWWRDHCLTEESARAVLAAAQKTLHKYSDEELNRLAELRIARVRQTLSNRGVAVSVRVCTGGMRMMLRHYARYDDATLIFMRIRGGVAMKSWRQMTFPAWLHRLVSAVFPRQPDPRQRGGDTSVTMPDSYV